MASGRQEKAEKILQKIAVTNNHPLPPGKLHDVHAQVRSSSQFFQKESPFSLSYFRMNVVQSKNCFMSISDAHRFY